MVTTDISTLRALERRLEQATGADRKLDFDIVVACGLLKGPPAKHVCFMPADKQWTITSSIDAALAFLNAVLPDTDRGTSATHFPHRSDPRRRWDYHVVLHVEPEEVVATHNSEPIALCLATIRAMIAMKEKERA